MIVYLPTAGIFLSYNNRNDKDSILKPDPWAAGYLSFEQRCGTIFNLTKAKDLF